MQESNVILCDHVAIDKLLLCHRHVMLLPTYVTTWEETAVVLACDFIVVPDISTDTHRVD